MNQDLSPKSSLLLNKATKRQLKSYLKHPTQGLLLIGNSGSGKTSAIEWLAIELLGLSSSTELERYPYLLRLVPDEGKQSIAIKSVREIDKFFGLAVRNNDQQLINRIVIIDDAELLSNDSQDALLKNLEEPPLRTTFLLSTSNPNLLFPTIKSRLISVRMVNPDRSQLIDHLKTLSVSDINANRAISMSGGVPGLAIALALDQKDHHLVKAAEVARQILHSNQYQRLAIANSLQKDQELTRSVIQIMQQMARLSLETAEADQSKRWQSVLKSAHEAELQLARNTNLRLTLIHLMIHL